MRVRRALVREGSRKLTYYDTCSGSFHACCHLLERGWCFEGFGKFAVVVRIAEEVGYCRTYLLRESISTRGPVIIFAVVIDMAAGDEEVVDDDWVEK
jgi:hypothetical protein